MSVTFAPGNVRTCVQPVLSSLCLSMCWTFESPRMKLTILPLGENRILNLRVVSCFLSVTLLMLVVTGLAPALGRGCFSTGASVLTLTVQFSAHTVAESIFACVGSVWHFISDRWKEGIAFFSHFDFRCFWRSDMLFISFDCSLTKLCSVLHSFCRLSILSCICCVIILSL